MFLIRILFVFNMYVLAVTAESADVNIISELTIMKEQFIEREKLYEKKLAEMEDRLRNAEENSKSLENFFQYKLAEAEERFYAEEKRRTSVEKFFENKIAEFEHKLSENAYGHKVKDLVSQDVESGTEPAMKPSKENTSKADTAELLTTEPVSPLFNRKLKEKGKRLLTLSGGNGIAFSSYLASTKTNLGYQSTIPFDRVLLNEGHSFNTYSHTFTCPVNGIYTFQSSLLCNNEGHIETEIVKDGSVLARLYAADDDYFNQAFNSATVRCNKGESVLVRVRDGNGHVVYAEQFSTFSGYLLWEI